MTTDETEDTTGDVPVDLDKDEIPMETPATEEIPDHEPKKSMPNAKRIATRTTKVNPPISKSMVSAAAITNIICDEEN